MNCATNLTLGLNIEFMSSFEKKPVYELLQDEARNDLQSIERLVEDAIGAERSMTSASLPEGFEAETLEDADFGFEASKIYEDGTEIDLEYRERSSISFNKSDSSSVEVNVNMPYTFTEHWDQRM